MGLRPASLIRVVQGEATPLGDWLDARSTQSPTTWLVERMAAPNVIDTRNVLNPASLTRAGCRVVGTGR